MTFDKELFQSIDYTDRREVEVGDGNLIGSIGSGTVIITLRDSQSLQLQDVLYVPNLTCHLISVGELTQGGYVCLFEAGGVHIIKRGRIEARGSKIDDVFELRDVVGVRINKAFAARLRPQHQKGDAELSASEYTELMHRRLGHLSESINRVNSPHADGIMGKLQPRTLGTCKTCVRSKFVRIINKKPGF